MPVFKTPQKRLSYLPRNVMKSKRLVAIAATCSVTGALILRKAGSTVERFSKRMPPKRW